MFECVRRRRRSSVLVLAGALVLSACGGGGGGGGGSQVASDEVDGATLFGATSPSCASCHTLTAAGASGRVGPDLDETTASAEQIESVIRQGPGSMPSFDGQLSDEQITALARYVDENATGGS